jgi:hypothetical protein
MKDILWNAIILDEFIRLALPTEFEIQLIRSRMADQSRVQQSFEFSRSLPRVDAAIKSIRQKYDAVQPYSDILPPRKKKL